MFRVQVEPAGHPVLKPNVSACGPGWVAIGYSTRKSEASLVQCSRAQDPGIGKSHELIRAVVIDAVSRNIGPALSWCKGEEDVGTGPAVSRGQVVGTAKPLIDFHQELIRPVALWGDEMKFPAGPPG